MGLSIFLLGQFKLQAENQLIELPSRPAQSLLAYLALNVGVTHRREKLASLLWPDATETNARSYLRQALWRIRKALESVALTSEDYLQISDISVTFDDQADFWLDTADLLAMAGSQSKEELIKTVRLYRGELLPGFYDEWVVLERDRLEAAFHQKINLLLERLIQAEEWDAALEWSEQWIRLGYAPEPAFRYLMQAHAGLGDLGMVTATYQRCVESLNRDLNLEPSSETNQLYERIRQGGSTEVFSPITHAATSGVQKPAFLEGEGVSPVEKPLFVARARELAQLEAQLDLALNGHGRMIFITGEAGSGKTALVDEFTHRAQEVHADLIVASGNCNAHTGIGDPYLPFREVLELLTGDVEARWAAGAISGKHAHLLWNTLPIAAQALLESGPDLIDTFVPGAALVERAAACAPTGADWLTRLQDIVDRKRTTPIIPSLQQSDLFEQYTRVLAALARQAPLVLVVDDLQWADTGSVGLLFHMGRHLIGSRILIVGAYRPEEVALEIAGERHPLMPVVNELQLQYGDILVNLGQADSREFMDTFLDSEPNQLGASFRQMLYQRTHGQPLFTIELLKGMQERGDLLQNQDGAWVEGPALDWETLPARVEAAIAERIGRLAQSLQAALQVASVAGEDFCAEVVAQVLEINEREMVQHMSSDLDRKYRLLQAQAIERLGSQRISLYRFRHYLCQKYLYDNLDQVERTYLHEDVGYALEQVYGDNASEVAVQLAWHFQVAGIKEKSVHYLHLAGQKAVQLSAYQEAIAHLNKGLELVKNLPNSPERTQQELAIQLVSGMAWSGYGSHASPEANQAYNRALELCQQLGDKRQACKIKGELAIFHYVRAEYRKARELADEALNLALEDKDPLLEALGRWYLGVIAFPIGDYTTTRLHLEQVIDFYRPQQHHYPLMQLRVSDAGLNALATYACCLWLIGYPDQALKRSQEALELAQELNHPFSLADVLWFAGCLFYTLRRDALAVKLNAEQLIALSHKLGIQGWLGDGIMYRGMALAMMGKLKEGIEQMHTGIAVHESIDLKCFLSGTLHAIAAAQAKASQSEDALTTLDEAFDMVKKTDEHLWEPELHRLRGEILLMQGDEVEAERSLLQALEVASQQKAKSWELRAATDLTRLWQTQGRLEEACDLLTPIYNWFTEGFDTPDLKAAHTLLEELSCH
jgi:predicted ATPase/DNA-binding SARP family transcriptional activator